MIERVLTISLVLFVAVLTFYYVWLFTGLRQADSAHRDTIQLALAPLPIAVGLIAALTGYFASREASTIVQRQSERDSAIEVRATAESAVSLYSEFLLSVSRAYVAAEVLRVSTEQPLESPADVDTMEAHGKALMARITVMGDTLHDMSLHPLARKCYLEKWSKTDLRTRLVEQRMENQGGVTSIARDPLLVSGLFATAVRAQKPESSGMKYVAMLLLARHAIDYLSESIEVDGSHLTFVFLGNIVGYTPQGLLGAAALIDMVTAIPRNNDMRACLMEHYRDNSSLSRASESVALEFDPLAVVPVISGIAHDLAASTLFTAYPGIERGGQ